MIQTCLMILQMFFLLLIVPSLVSLIFVLVFLLTYLFIYIRASKLDMPLNCFLMSKDIKSWSFDIYGTNHVIKASIRGIT